MLECGVGVGIDSFCHTFIMKRTALILSGSVHDKCWDIHVCQRNSDSKPATVVFEVSGDQCYDDRRR